MIKFILGVIVGIFIGITIMCSLILSKKGEN